MSFLRMIQLLIAAAAFCAADPRVLHAQTAVETLLAAHQDFLRLTDPKQEDLLVTYRYVGDARRREGERPSSADVTALEAEFPYPVSRDLFLLGGLSAGRWGNFLDNRYQERTLLQVAPEFEAGMFLDDDDFLAGTCSPGFAADDDSLFSSDSIFTPCSIFLTRRPTSGFAIHAGTEFIDAAALSSGIPLLGLSASFGDGSGHASVILPSEARIAYRLADQLEVYLGAWWDESRYRLHDEGARRVTLDEVRVGGGAETTFYGISLAIDAGSARNSVRYRGISGDENVWAWSPYAQISISPPLLA